MGKVASLGFGVIGGFVGGLFTAGAFSGIGFSLGSTIGGGLLAKNQKRPRRDNPTPDGVSVPFFGNEYFGTVPNVRPQLIQCGRDKRGLQAAIQIETQTEGGGCGEPEIETDVGYLYAALFIGSTHNSGPLFVDKYEIDTGAGWETEWDRYASKNKHDLVPTFAQGQVIAETSEKLRLYPGTAIQMPDSALQEWWGDEITAYRFSSYMVLNRIKAASGSATHRITVRNLKTGRRQLVRMALKPAIPGHRILLAHITGDVEGIKITSQGAPREFCEVVTRPSFCDLTGDGARIIDVSKISPTIHEITYKDVGARTGKTEDGTNPPSEALKFKGAIDKPSIMRLAFSDIDTDGEGNAAEVKRETATHSNEASLDMSAEVMNITTATRLAAAELDDNWNQDHEWKAALMPSKANVLQGDVLRLTTETDDGQTQTVDYRVTERERQNSTILDITGAPWNPRVFHQPGVRASTTRPTDAPRVPGAPIGFLTQTVPLLGNMLEGVRVLAGACPDEGQEWEGAWFKGEFGNTKTKLNTPASIGELMADVELGEVWAFDEARTIPVKMHYGRPESTTMELARGRANLLLLETGRVLSFVSVSQTGENLFTLTSIRDGRFGTDCGDQLPTGYDIARIALAGTKFVLLTDKNEVETTALKAMRRDGDGLGKIKGFYFHPSGDSSKRETRNVKLTGENLKPLAPVAVRFTRTESGGATITGRAQTRFFEDGAWERAIAGQPSDTINGKFEFELWLYNAGFPRSVRRTSDTSSFSFEFTSGELEELFGSVPATITGHVAQVSPILGAGRARPFIQ